MFEDLLDKTYLSVEMVTRKSLVISAKLYHWSLDTSQLLLSGQMTTICRYVDEKGQPRERLLFLKPITPKTGEATADYIILTLSNFLDAEELVL